MRQGEGDVDAANDHRLQRGIGGRFAEAVEPAMLEIRDARRELEAEQTAQREIVSSHTPNWAATSRFMALSA